MENKDVHLISQSTNEDVEVVGMNSICRLCANQDDKLIGVFSEEGITNEIATKINLYLPVKVDVTDELPLQCCWNCASTILAWHELVLASSEADRRFRASLIVAEKPLLTTIELRTDCAEEDNKEGIRAEPLSTSLNDFCQTELHSLDKKVKNPEESLFTPSDDAPFMSDIEQHFIEEPPLSNDYKIDLDTSNLSEDVKLDQLECSDSSSEKEDPSYFACQYCPAIFITKQAIVNHVDNDHSGKECIITPITEQIHSVKRERRKNNKIDQDMTNEAKVIVDGRIYYNCKVCGKSLHSPYTYVWHMRIHTGERPYVCDLCGKQFRVSQGLVRHLRETHQGIKKFPCDICGRMFSTRRNVEEHRRIHTNERPYVCDLCGKSFKQKASLFVHKRSHKNFFPFKCSYCNQGFRTKPPLLVHVTRHTGEKPYKCDVCGRCFRIKYELKRHRLIHSDEKPFVCTVCGLSFRQKRYLRNHNKSNHNLNTA